MILRTVLDIFLLCATFAAEFYTSLDILKIIIGAGRDIPIMINGYVEKELERLDCLKKLAQEMQGRSNKTIRDPISAFLLIKRMTTDWNKALKIMRSNSANDVIRDMTHQQAIKHISYPTEEDLSGAAIGLLRLQDTYQMDIKDIADGKILNSQRRAVALTAGDCFEIGRAAYNEYDYYHTIMWMQEARERVEKNANPTANLEDIREYLAFSLYEQGNLKRALLLTDELHRMSPNHPRAKNNIREYEYLLKNDGVQRIDMRRDIPPINNIRRESELDEGVKLTYEALCRQEVPADTKAQPQLYCYYKMDHPYLRLAPFKIEIVRQNPLAALFYEIMSNEEARIIRMLAMPKACLIKLDVIRNLLPAYLESTFAYLLKSARLKSTEHEIVKRIDRRIELATNLEMETAENLAMTEPEIGGRTVFMTSLQISLPCIRNAALFWYNLMRSGEIDTRSRHGACPVLTGIKWMVAKWIRERGQEWRRPCSLNQFDQERYVGDLGAPEPKYSSNIRSEAKNSKKISRKH